MTPDNENPKDQVDENVPDDAVEETPQAEGTSDEPVDQQERADKRPLRGDGCCRRGRRGGRRGRHGDRYGCCR